MQPNNNMVNNTAPAPTPAPMTTPTPTPMNPGGDVVFKDKPKKKTGMIIGMVVLALLAAGGIAFGIWAYLDGNSRVAKKDEQISNLQNQLAKQPEEEEIIIDEDTESDTNTADYIYVGEWGLKIKIPDSLSSVSYRYSQEAGYTKVTVWGVDCSSGKCQYFPDYANVNNNTSGMGSIARYTKGTTFDPGSAPILIFSDETYDYYYCHPQVAYSVDKSSDETEWEAAGIEIIEKILSNSDNYSKI